MKRYNIYAVYFIASLLFGLIGITSCGGDNGSTNLNFDNEKASIPDFSVKGGTYINDITVEITSADDNGIIYYTDDGSEVDTSSKLYDTPIIISGDGTETTIRAFVQAEGKENSDVPSEKYKIQYNTINTVAPPVFTPSGGMYGDDIQVGISCSTDGAQIRYTTDGSEPTVDSPLYNQSIAVSGHGTSMTIKALGIKSDYGNSSITEAVFVINKTPRFAASSCSLSFDMDLDDDEIESDLTIGKADDETSIVSYVLYWGTDPSTKVTGQSAITEYAVAGTTLSHSFSTNTVLPAGTQYVLVYSKNSFGEGECNSAKIPDSVLSTVTSSYEFDFNQYQEHILYNGDIYFCAEGETPNNNGRELWKIDTESNTASEVADINSGAGGSEPDNFNILNGKLIFSADTPSLGRELYSYSGSGSPTLIKDIRSGIDESIRSYDDGTNYTYVYNSKLYFQKVTPDYYELWVYDGTNDPYELYSSLACSNPESFVESNGKLFFSGYDSTNGIELWVYDSTQSTSSTNPKLVADINSGTNNGVDYGPRIQYGNDLYFRAEGSDGKGRELWKYNGTSVSRISDINTSGDSLYDENGFIEYKNKLYFTAYDGTYDGFYSYNGTVITKIYKTGEGYDVSNLILYKDILFFGAGAPSGLWMYSGTGVPTFITNSIGSGGGDYLEFVLSNSKLYIFDNDDQAIHSFEIQ